MTAQVDKRLEQGARSRQEILDAAERVMSHQGYNGTSVALISKESGLPNSSIYWHFESKSAILAAVMERGARRFFEQTPLVRIDDPSPQARLEANLVLASETIIANRDFLRLLLLLVISNHDPKVQRVIADVRHEGRRRIRAIVEYAFETHGARAAAVADEYADYALACFDGIFFALQANPDLPFAGEIAKFAQAIALLGEQFLAGPR
ncbi:MAG: TetR/AcrR family transcriptional regulator [Thermomicrobiales bacterium]|nr:TetR/AcrR family transcriptional regulator [Thermomicrobiales bacterium]